MRDIGDTWRWGYSLWRTPCFSSWVRALSTPGQLLPEIERIWVALSPSLWHHSLFYRGSVTAQAGWKRRDNFTSVFTLKKWAGQGLSWTGGKTRGRCKDGHRRSLQRHSTNNMKLTKQCMEHSDFKSSPLDSTANMRLRNKQARTQ